MIKQAKLTGQKETKDRVVMANSQEDDRTFDLTLRPKTLAEYIGQSKIKESLTIFLAAAKKRRSPLEHVIVHGPSGIGKTTLAHVIANEMGVEIRVTSGPAIERAGDLASLLTNLTEGSILFIDEIHRLPRVIEEILYPAMEDYALDIILGKGPGARSVRLELPQFTLIGATTRFGLLSSPLRDRFGHMLRLDYYEQEEIERITKRSAGILGITVNGEGVSEIARRARRTPRIANRLLRRVRDYADIKANGRITDQVAREALDMLAVDELGLDQNDRRILEVLIEKFNGGPAGLQAIAAACSEEEDTISDIYEPYLMRMGLIIRTPKGRMATPHAYEHLGLTTPETLQSKLL
jgi:Holliday junction DNA helicase RuvB